MHERDLIKEHNFVASQRRVLGSQTPTSKTRTQAVPGSKPEMMRELLCVSFSPGLIKHRLNFIALQFGFLLSHSTNTTLVKIINPYC